MHKRRGAHQPLRNRHGDLIYTTVQQRPHPDFSLAPFYRGMEIFTGLIAIGLPLVFVTLGVLDVEAAVTLILLGLSTIGCLVLSRFPRVMNYPVMLHERNVQQQYRYGVQMMLWVAAACAGLMVVLTGEWLTSTSLGLFWLPLAVIFIAMGHFIWRMFKTQ